MEEEESGRQEVEMKKTRRAKEERPEERDFKKDRRVKDE